jgi:hypothetical protein
MPENYKLARSEAIKLFLHESKLGLAKEADALLIVESWNARLSTAKSAGFWPTVGTALTAKHRWARILCESCDSIADFDISMKPRDPEASVRVILKDVRCPRCNGHGRPRILSLSRLPHR